MDAGGVIMGFGNRGYLPLPKTKDACQKLWEDASPRTLKKGYLTLGNNTELHIEYGVFTLKFHSKGIVKYLDGFKVVDACGYSSSPTTQDRISRATGAYMMSNQSLGFEQPIRIGGYPYFDGIRVDDYGHVLEADRRPDFKRVCVKSVIQQYTTLFKRIEKLCIGRFELGEWGERSYRGDSYARPALQHIEERIAAGETFLDTTQMSALLGISQNPDFRACLKDVKESLRDWYYRTNGGYERIEVTK
jgi:hypothetical protein